jgi:hypothetical protein
MGRGKYVNYVAIVVSYQGLGGIGKEMTEFVMTTYLKGAESTRGERKRTSV